MKPKTTLLSAMYALLFSLVNSYRLNDRINTFKNIKIKFNKLTHLIESITNKNSYGGTDGEIDKAIIDNIINEYDKLFEDLTYQFPHHIKQKVIKKWGGVKTLPNSLEIENNYSKGDLVNTNV